MSGAGMGLYLSRELARQHGGDIRIESTDGAGSTFSVSLPLAVARPETPLAVPVTPEPEPSVLRLHVLAGEGDAGAESRLA